MKIRRSLLYILLILSLIIFSGVNDFAFALLVIDPGHGGYDPGATAVNGTQQVYEKNLNLSVANYLNSYLNAYGFDTTMTRTGDIFISLEQRAGFSNSKPTDLFISIHHNSALTKEAAGVETYYYPTNADGKALAELICSNLSSALQTKNRGAKPSTDLYVIRNTKATAVLVECGFMSNPEELSKLIRDDVQKKEGKAIADAVRDFFVKKAFSSGVIKRIFGLDRIQTSVEISRSFFNSSEWAVLVNAYSYADAISASALSGALNCPIFLTRSNYLSDEVLNEMKSKNVSKVLIVGGFSCIDSSIENLLKKSGFFVQRCAGKDRYETGLKIVEFLLNLNNPDYIFICSNESVADAVSCSNLAASSKSPVLFVKKDVIPYFTRIAVEKIKKANPEVQAVVIGGESIVSESTARALGSLVRLYGSDRYGTSVACEDFGLKEGLASTSTIMFASGIDPVDALVSSSISLPFKPVLLLTDSSCLRFCTKAFVSKNTTSSSKYLLFGGPSVLSAEIERQLTANWINK